MDERENIYFELNKDNRTNEFTKFDNDDHITQRRELKLQKKICIFEKTNKKVNRVITIKIRKRVTSSQKNQFLELAWLLESVFHSTINQYNKV